MAIDRLGTRHDVFAATFCPFHHDETIDEDGLRGYIRDLCAVKGLVGLVPKGPAGEIMSRRESERAAVTAIVVEMAPRPVPESGVPSAGAAAV